MITKKTITALFKDKFKIFFNIYQFGFIFFKNNKLNIIWIVNKERLYRGKIKKIEKRLMLAKQNNAT